MSLKTSTRINKYISESGLCSRREADRFVEQGNVWINGRRATTGDQVVPGDRVKVNGQQIEPQEAEDLVLIALNKPVGIVSTTEPGEKANIVDFVGHGVRIFPIGRLDKDSRGLIFLTNNGDLVNKILRANNQHEKEYLVTVDKPITDAFIAGMQAGVPILGQVTQKCRVQKVSSHTFNITLVQGLNRQIRRMCEHFGFEVVELVRTRIMNIPLKGLANGDWRDLTPREIETLFKRIEHSDAAPPVEQRGKPRGQRGASGATPGNKPGGRTNARPDQSRAAKSGGKGKPPARTNIAGGKPKAAGNSAHPANRSGKPGGKGAGKTRPGSSRPVRGRPPRGKR